MNKIISSQSVGEIVAKLPKAGEIFSDLKTDYCCGGHKTLSSVIKEQGLDEVEILKELNKAIDEMSSDSIVDFNVLSSADLIAHIKNNHHVYVKRTLPELADWTNRIMWAHGENHNELLKIHKLYSGLKAELEQHLYTEEEILFPMLIEYEQSPSEQLLKKIEYILGSTKEEHEAAGNVLKQLRLLSNDYSVPEDGCSTYYNTYLKLEEFEADLFQHIHLENNILFKKLGSDEKEN